MLRTSIELDKDLLTRVQQVLGTNGIKDTVERAFQEVVRADLRRQLARRVKSGEGVDRGESIFEATRRNR